MSSLIVKVNKVDAVINHPFADRLDIVTVLGWNCIVLRDQYKVGDLVVYIPPDSLIPDNLIEEYQLEYMRGKNRLRTIKLRGCVSQGLILPPKKGWVEGQDVAEKLGITKYEPPKASYDISGGRTNTNRNPNTEFHKYSSIENIKNYNNVFAEGDPVVITEKVHGCLQADTMISLADGSRMKIKDIVEDKLDVEVLSMNDEGQLVPSKILNWFNNGRTDIWRKVKTTRKGLNRGNSFSSIICTENHQFYNPNTCEYVACKDLKVGDSVLMQRNDLELTFIQKQILIGKMLGDGTLSNKSIQFGHKKEDEEYLHFTMNSLGNISGNQQKNVASGYGTEMVRARSISSPLIVDLFDDWFDDNGVKIVPENIDLAPISLAFWYMDDGSLGHNDNQNDRAYFATCGFNEESIDNLIVALKKLNIQAEKRFTDGKYFRIWLNADNADKLFSLIYPYVTYCMQYKLPEIYRGNKPCLPIESNAQFKPWLVEQEIISIENVVDTSKINKTKYDLETEYHNFIADHILVHNSNFRAGRVKAMKPNTWLGKLKRKLLDMLGLLDEYEFVYGSHNVQLSYTGHKGWYESNVYAKIAHKYNLMDVPDGFVVYGEIYGKGIQDLEYGLNDIDLVVFDIKYEGEYISYDEMVQFCAVHNLPVAPVLFYGKYDPTTLEDFTNGDSILNMMNNGKKQIREGCIVKSLYEENDIHCGRKILKSISPPYLMRKNATEYH